MTKGFTNADNWEGATALIGMRPKEDTKHLYGVNVIPPPAKIPKPPKTKSESWGVWDVVGAKRCVDPC